MHILIVLTSHATLGDTGRPTGYWLDEFAAPYYAFADAGATLTLASPLGGRPPIDPSSEVPDARTACTARFDADDHLQDLLGRTVPLGDVPSDEVDALFYPGGHGPLWDLPDNPDSISLLQACARTGRPIAAVCHGPIALKNVRLDDRTLLVAGRDVTAFSNSEEAAVGLTDVVPELLEDVLRSAGANYLRTPEDFTPFVVTDGTLITGQNPASSAPAAECLLELLG